jgi:ActR/RegA family two-component response regulator
MSPTNRKSDVVGFKGVPVLVEDAWHVAKAMKASLEQLGMQVIGPTATCAEAKRLVVEKKPKVALVDVNLKREKAYGLIDELYAQSVQVTWFPATRFLWYPRNVLQRSCRNRSLNQN